MRACLLVIAAGCRFGFEAPPSDAADAADAADGAITDALVTDISDATSRDVAASGNDTCATRITLVLGAAPTLGTTCGADDSVTVGCSNGVTDVFYTFDQPAMTTATLSLTAGFTALVDSTGNCNQFAPGCAASGDSLSNGTNVTATWILAVERSGGNCGSFNIGVQ